MAKHWWDWTWGKAVGITLAGVAAGLAFATLESTGYSYGGRGTADRNRDPKLLLPSFAWKLELLFRKMRDRGFDPFLNEGRRTVARAIELGKGTTDLHIFGAAVDIISASSGLSDPAFFKALGEEADPLGLTWGGKIQYDLNHIQAIPNFLASELRARETAGGRDAFLREYYQA